jgi:hypothetical protein
MDISELLALPTTVDLRTAARALGLGSDKAYTLAKMDRFPCRVRRFGHKYKITRADLFAALGLDPVATTAPEDETERAREVPPEVPPEAPPGAGLVHSSEVPLELRVLYAALLAAARVLVEHGDLT